MCSTFYNIFCCGTGGKILNGLIIQLRQLEANNISKYSYNGTIEIRYLNGAIKLISEVKNGYIGALNTDPLARPLVVPQAKEEYPQIIVDWYYGGTPYINSSGFFGFNSGSRSVNYSSIAASENNEGDQGSRSNSQNNNEDDEELVDFEFIDNLTPIDISKYLKCFSTIPDYGATCSIAILVNIPVDDNPNSIFDFKQGATGHTFLQITKTNGGQTVTQNIDGEAWRGFFLLYLLLGLPYGAIHSVLALVAIIILILNLHKYRRRETIKACLLEILGVLLLLLSLFLFFYNDTTHYNYGTFYFLVPVITLGLFTILAVSSLIMNIVAIYKISTKEHFHNLNS
ncbi:hypothetical protein [Segetibacter koreensis]|uniref:hypothetical protein n=2 Tax=Segetibacter koreensis TaxID=398037 RepID=UPI00037D3AAF|nr:hypothetical protein [Segetibacter koreensis]